jgi:hypothetical protein
MGVETVQLDRVTAADFAPHVGTGFDAGLGEGAERVAILTLTEASVSKVTGENSRPFSLYFEGPPDIALPQDCYWLSHPVLGTLFIFIVPISADANRRQYQAVFN